jgi:hypothetical protein
VSDTLDKIKSEIKESSDSRKAKYARRKSLPPQVKTIHL